jgi:hypothetical protein
MTRRENLKFKGYRFLAFIFAELAFRFEQCAKKCSKIEIEMVSRAAVI